MKLTSLINILFHGIVEQEVRNLGVFRLTFKTKEELESKVTNIYNIFEDSDEPISEPKLVSDWILNQMDIKTYVPNLEKVNSNFTKNNIYDGRSLEDIKETDPEFYGILYKSLVELRNQELAKGGMKYIDLTKEDMYRLFSQSSFRDKRLNQII
jgi:hypothetical protein